MKNELLLIPDKPDIERDAIADIWKRNGGEVKRVGAFWKRPDIDTRRITIYGNDTFSLVLAQVTGLKLIEPKDEVLSDISFTYVKRNITILTIPDIETLVFPTFLKPVKPKTFPSQVYTSYANFLENTKGIEAHEQVIHSDRIQIDAEVRAFIIHHEILDLAIYEGSADLSEAKKFLYEFLNTTTIDVPITYVIDLGYNSDDHWFIIEFNSSWGAGLNECNPNKVIKGIREATVNS